MNILGLCKSAALLLGKHKSAILAGASIVSAIGTTGLAIHATVKATKSVVEASEKKKKLAKDPNSEDVKLTKVEIIQASWKHYVPVVLGTITTGTCIICAHKIDAKRIAAATSALLISEKMNKELEEKTIGEIGKDKFDELKGKIFKENPDLQRKFGNNRGREVMGIDLYNQYPPYHDGMTWFKDPLSGRIFKATRNQLERSVNAALKDALDTSGIITLNDWYRALDIDDTELGDVHGWRVCDGQTFDITYEPDIAENGEPCLVIQYYCKPTII